MATSTVRADVLPLNADTSAPHKIAPAGHCAARAPEALARLRREAAQRPTLGNAGVRSPTAGQSLAELLVEDAPAPDDSDLRWAVHRAMWKVSPLKKVRSCRRYASGGGMADVGTSSQTGGGHRQYDSEGGETYLPVRATRQQDGGLSVGVGGLKTCASWHSCQACGVKIAVHRARELEHIFKVWEALGGSVVLATFTCRHYKGQRLADLVKGQRAGWAAVQSDRPWRADLAELGVAVVDAHEDERKVLLDVLGRAKDPDVIAAAKRDLRKLRKTTCVIRAFEATYGDEHGHHPHYHVFFLVEGKISREEAEAAVAPMWNRWCAGLAEQKLTAVDKVDGEDAGFNVRVLGDGDSGQWARYPFKLALEAVGGVFKRGRNQDSEGRLVGQRHRTPFEIMEHYAVAVSKGEADDDQAREDLAIITEWSQTANDMRFRQCPLPPGMRAWFAKKAAELGIPGPLLEAEQTDEEVAEAEEQDTETIGHMPASVWTTTVAYELDTLKHAARRRGVAGVLAWFEQRGIDFELSETGQAWLVAEADRPPPGAVVAVWSGWERASVR